MCKLKPYELKNSCTVYNGGVNFENLLSIVITGLCEFVRRCIETDACPVLEV